MTKKILIANSHIPWGGLGQFTITLAKGLRDSGFEVYGLVTHHNDQLYDQFVELTNETKFLGSFNKIIKYIKCIRTIRKFAPDVIIINYLATVHFILPFIRRSKILSIIHSDQKDFYRIAQINKRFVDLWVVPSKKVRDAFINYLNSYKYGERIVIIPHGVSQSKSDLRRKNESTFNIVFIGALFTHKGVDLLPEIFKRFHDQCPDSCLTVIGEGDLQGFLVEQLKELSLSEFVIFKGVIPNEQVRELLREMDVLCLPTRIESFGLVIVEAMMEGAVPVVTLLKDITDEIIENTNTGYLIEMDNIPEFISVFKNLYSNRDLLQKISHNAMKKGSEQFSADVMIKRYVEFLLFAQPD